MHDRRLLLAYLVAPLVGILLLVVVAAVFVSGGRSLAERVLVSLHASLSFGMFALPIAYLVEWVVVSAVRTTRFDPATMPAVRVVLICAVTGGLALAATFGVLIDALLQPLVWLAGALCGAVIGVTFSFLRRLP